jgi:glutathione S-transferase
MKLYVDRNGTAPSPRRVRIFLAEKGLDVPLQRLAIHEENRTEEFRKKNLGGTLPVLELDDGTCIAESVAICRYLEELHPEPSLFGTTPLERAHVEMWTRRVELWLYLPIEFAGFLEGEAQELFRKGCQRTVRRFDTVLAEREFLAGDRYTMADAFALSAVDFGLAYAGFTIDASHTHFLRWHGAVSARPSARA